MAKLQFLGYPSNVFIYLEEFPFDPKKQKKSSFDKHRQELYQLLTRGWRTGGIREGLLTRVIAIKRRILYNGPDRPLSHPRLKLRWCWTQALTSTAPRWNWVNATGLILRSCQEKCKAIRKEAGRQQRDAPYVNGTREAARTERDDDKRSFIASPHQW